MPISYFRRPLFAALVLYMLALSVLGARGFFRVRVAEEAVALSRRSAALVDGRVVSGFAPKKLGDRVWLETERVGPLAARLRVMAYLPRKDPAVAGVRPGQRVRLEGKLRLGRRARAPGDFDERAYLETQGSAFVLHARRLETLEADPPWAWRPWAAAESARRSIHAYALRRFPQTTASLLEGFLIGSKAPLPSAVDRAIRDAGAAHLLVPSGTNVALILWLAVGLGGALGLSWGARLAAASAVGAFYGLMAGCEAPYLRAYLAALALYAARILDRPAPAFSGFTLAAWATLLWDPRAFFSASFQMTYLAVLGLMLAMGRWRTPEDWPRPCRAVLQVLLISVVVQLMLLPVSARAFGRVSAAGLVSNVLLVPVSGVLLVAGFAAWGLSFLPWGLPESAAAALASGLVRFFRAVCEAFAAWPCAAVDVPPLSAGAAAAYYAFLVGALLWPSRGK